MDFLIENNLMTQRRIIIDVGHQKTKILFVTYKKNKMTVESCIMMDSEPWMQDIMELTAPEKLAEAVYDFLKSNAHYRKAEIAILLPSEMFQIEAIELNDIANKKDLEEQLDKSVKSSANARNLRESTTVIDSTVFGTYEQGGRIIYSCAMLSLPKAVADSIYKAFREKGLNITHLSDGHLGLAYISELYVDDYEHVSKLFLDVGVYSTRVMIQSERVCVYWHEIPMGVSTFINDVVENMGFLEDEAANILLGDESSFEEHDIEAIKNATEHSMTRFRDEIGRVFAHCEEALEIDPVSKVIEINNPLPRFLSESLYSDLTYIVTERLKVNHKEPILGGNIVIESEVADNVGNDPEYNMAIGYAIEPMLHKRKRPNLLLNEHKDKIVGKYINRAVGTIVGGIAAVCLVAGMVSVGQNLYIKFLTSTQDKQSELKNDISKLQSDIQDTQELIANYKQRLFDCNDFVECVLGLKPANVTILSVDSADVIEYTAGLQKQEEDATKKKKSDDTDKNENSEENTEEKQIFSVSKPGYKDDIVNKRIILRGYSQDQTAISEYVYNMSRLNSVKSVEIAGVEEKKMLNVGKQCVFEMFMDIQNAD